MIGLAAGTRIWIVAGVTDMRRGFVGLSGMVQTALKENPFSGQVFVFRGKRYDLLRLVPLHRHIQHSSRVKFSLTPAGLV
jgi:transposase